MGGFLAFDFELDAALMGKVVERPLVRRSLN